MDSSNLVRHTLVVVLPILAVQLGVQAVRADVRFGDALGEIVAHLSIGEDALHLADFDLPIIRETSSQMPELRTYMRVCMYFLDATVKGFGTCYRSSA